MPVMLSSVHPIIVLECSAIRAYVQQKKEMLHLVVFSGYSVIIKVRYCSTVVPVIKGHMTCFRMMVGMIVLMLIIIIIETSFPS